jgi:hypothetical protein
MGGERDEGLEEEMRGRTTRNAQTHTHKQAGAHAPVRCFRLRFHTFATPGPKRVASFIAGYSADARNTHSWTTDGMVGEYLSQWYPLLQFQWNSNKELEKLQYSTVCADWFFCFFSARVFAYFKR